MAKLECLAPDQRPQTQWQIISSRQHGSINQYRYHSNIPLQGCFDLDANKVVWIVKPPLSAAIGESRPVWSH